jgi:thiol-disulfide isomerase/thioredoxin
MVSEIEPAAVEDAHDSADPGSGHEPPPAPDAPRRRWLVPRLVLVVLLVIVAVAGVRAVAQRVGGDSGDGGLLVADQQAIASRVAHRQVSFQGRLLADRRAWSSPSARGQVLVVNFWASWCGPCRAEQPALSAVARAWRGRGVAFIGVNVQDSRAAALAYTREFAVPYPSLFDPSAQTATRLRAVALPTTFILDRDGVIADQLTGKTTVPILRARLDALLAKGGRWSA